jgi:hypothetical protein
MGKTTRAQAMAAGVQKSVSHAMIGGGRKLAQPKIHGRAAPRFWLWLGKIERHFCRFARPSTQFPNSPENLSTAKGC